MENDKLLLNDVRKNLNEIRKLTRKQGNVDRAKKLYSTLDLKYRKIMSAKTESQDSVIDLLLETEKTLEVFKAESKWYKRIARIPQNIEEGSDKESIIHYIFAFFRAVFEYIATVFKALGELVPQNSEDDDYGNKQ